VSLVVPFVLVFIVLGSFLSEGAWQNMILTLGAGALGYAMKRFGYPRAPLVIGFVLGRLAETNLTLALQLWGWAFLARPMTAVLLGLALLSVAAHLWSGFRRGAAASPASPGAQNGDLLSGLVTAALGGYLAVSLGFPGFARLFPLVVGIPGAILAAAQFVLDLRGRAARDADRATRGGWRTVGAVLAGQELGVLWWAAALVGLTLAVGFGASIPLFLALFLRIRGKENWPVTAALAGAGWAFVYLVFTVGMKVFLFPGLLLRWFT
jgi:hypothetical protein